MRPSMNTLALLAMLTRYGSTPIDEKEALQLECDPLFQAGFDEVEKDLMTYGRGVCIVGMDFTGAEERIAAMLIHQPAGIVFIDHPDQLSPITGDSADVAILDDFEAFTGHRRMESMVQLARRGNKLAMMAEILLAGLGAMAHRFDDYEVAPMVMPDLKWERDVRPLEHTFEHPKPKPVKIKQAPKMPFKKTMRSVNRNR